MEGGGITRDYMRGTGRAGFYKVVEGWGLCKVLRERRSSCTGGCTCTCMLMGTECIGGTWHRGEVVIAERGAVARKE